MILYKKIQELIMKCIVRDVSVKAFREQFVPLFFSINRRLDIDAVVLADNVDNLYADLLIGALTEDQFRMKLMQLAVIATEVARIEWALETTTATLRVGEVVQNQAPEETSSDVQLLRFACA